MNSIVLFLGICIVLGVWLISAISYPTVHWVFFSSLPESEIQQYFIGIALSIAGVSLLYWFGHKTKMILRPGIVMAIMLTSVAILTAGFERLIQTEGFRNQLLVMGITTASRFNIALFMLIVSGYFFVFTFSPVLSKEKIPSLIYEMRHIAVIVGIILLTFHVGYLAMFDHASYAGSIFATLHGKPPLTYFSWYGFLSIATLSAIFRLVPLTLLNLTIFTSVAATAGYIMLYFLMRKLVGHQYFITLVAILLIIGINWIVIGSMRNTSPQSTVLRFGMWIPIAFLIYWEVLARNTTSRSIRRMFVDLGVAIAFYWTFDIGVYVVVAYLLFRWIESLKPGVFETLRLYIVSLLRTIGSILLVGMVVHAFYIWVLGITPQWQYFFGVSLIYLANTFFLMVLPDSILPWILLTPLVLAILVYIAEKRVSDKVPIEDSLLLFIAVYGVVQFAYFMGRSSLGNLNTIAIPSVMCFVTLCYRAIQWAKLGDTRWALGIVLPVSMLLAYPTYLLIPAAIQNLKRENILSSLATVSHPQGTEEDLFGETAKRIQTSYGPYINEHGIALVTIYDIWFMILLDRPSALGNECIICYVVPIQAQSTIDAISTRSHRYLFVDHDKNLAYGGVRWIFDPVEKYYRWKENLGWLDVYERL